jgi:tripartite-type tricarboxylate transporter receptor subunit TctC
MKRLRLLPALLATCLLASPGVVTAQNYPVKPIRLIVPFAAGGNADIIGRIIAQKFPETLGQQVVVDNRAGANSVIGTELAAKATPDGYTLLLIATGHTINPGLYSKLPFDLVRDFKAISLVGSTPIILAATNALPARTVNELVAVARSKPGRLSFATQGNGSPGHLAGVMFNTANKIDIVHVPYKSTAQAITDLTSGQVQVMYPSMTAVLPHIKAGKLKGIAIATRQRSPVMPNLPTIAESGVAGYEASIWNGVLAPAGTPKPIVGRLNAAMVKIMEATDVKERITAMGASPLTSTPEQFSAFIASEIGKWGKAIKDSGARVD